MRNVYLTSLNTVDGWTQVIYPIIFRFFFTSNRWLFGISAINSSWWLMLVIHYSRYYRDTSPQEINLSTTAAQVGLQEDGWRF